MIALLLIPSGLSWSHSRRVWTPEELPVLWYAGEGAPPGVSEDAYTAALQQAWQTWEQASSCTGLSSTFGGTVTVEKRDFDGLNVFHPGDARGELITPSETWSSSDDYAFSLSNLAYYSFSESDTVFSDAVSWTTADDTGCTDAYLIEAAALHQVGHHLGLGHSCEEGETCSEDELAAVMYWDQQPCDARLSLGADDIAGLEALYAPQVDVRTSSYTTHVVTETGYIGVTPMEFCVWGDATLSVAGGTWDFGDGGTAPFDYEKLTCHTYNAAGTYTVTLDVEGTTEGCGGVDDESYEIVACDAIGAASMTVSESAGVLQLVDTSGVPADDCLLEQRWEVWDADGYLDFAAMGAEAQTHPLPPGDYRVTLTLRDPAGTVTAEQSVAVVGSADTGDTASAETDEPEGGAGCGCATARGRTGAGLSILGLLLWPLLRRRPGDVRA